MKKQKKIKQMPNNNQFNKYPFNLRITKDMCKAANQLCVQMCPDEKVDIGDFYIANSSKGPLLLECQSLRDNGSIVVPTTQATYWFDQWDCVKVIEI